MADETDPPTGRAPRARTAPGVAPKNRDDLSDEARADRARSIPEYTGDDITGQVMALSDEEIVADDPDLPDEVEELTSEERAEVRERRLVRDREARPTMQRVRHLERKMDKVVPALEFIRGKVEVLPDLVKDAAKAAREAATASNDLAAAHRRATVTTTIETGGEAAASEIKVNTAERLETIDKRKTWREIAMLVLKIAVGVLASLAGVGEAVRQLGGK